MRWSKLEHEACSVARTISVIGDRWTLLILRDCFLRVRRFEDFQARLGVTRPILASRLRKLVKQFVLARVPYQQRPLRYEYRLTEKGLDLYPIVMSIVHWGDVHMAGKKGRPLLHEHMTCGKTFDPIVVCSQCSEKLNPREVHVHRGPGAASAKHMPPGVELKARKRLRARP
jgi:DNA-binding HxlR family transcriptional regulator